MEAKRGCANPQFAATCCLDRLMIYGQALTLGAIDRCGLTIIA